jgi:protein-S-isoprenylcysteine O-methyltransferase Ste14
VDEAAYRVGMNIIIGGCLGRAAVANVLAVRTFARRSRFVTLRMGWAERVTLPEPFVLGVVTFWVLLRGSNWENPSGAQAAAAAIGGALAFAGLALVLWAFASWHGHFVGHGVLPDQRLVTRGAYGFVRHPAYVCAFLMWAGLGLGSLNAVVVLVGALYVVPAYALYIRTEEEMMLGAFGDEYAQYQQQVPMLVPRLWPWRAGSASTPVPSRRT